MKSINRQHTLRKQKILDKSIQLLLKHGYQNTNIRAISQAVGFEGPGFYHYFSSKDDLLRQILEKSTKQFEEEVIRKVKTIDDPEEKIRTTIRVVINLLINSKETILIIDDSLLKGYKKTAREVYRKPFLLLREIVKELAKTRLIENSVDPTVATFSLIGMLTWTYKWYNPKGRISIDELSDQITQLYFNGFIGRSASLP